MIQKPEVVNEEDLIEITKSVELKAFLRKDDIMGLHIVLYVNRGNDENAVGVNVHPSISEKLLALFNEDGSLK